MKKLPTFPEAYNNFAVSSSHVQPGVHAEHQQFCINMTCESKSWLNGNIVFPNANEQINKKSILPIFLSDCTRYLAR